eukprot:TRINITY_DN1633_c0_g3_i1.p1 TRINITY_DN1633_c0_g3~~TRINITY_DN1633_c0_g3_i1.p1  ORF type:complete len:184 (-),score=25.27 TRINITY_DN1633_c0_g3_i1:62-613(-)
MWFYLGVGGNLLLVWYTFFSSTWSFFCCCIAITWPSQLLLESSLPIGYVILKQGKLKRNRVDWSSFPPVVLEQCHQAPNITRTQKEEFFQQKYVPRKIHGTVSPFEPRWCSICEAFKPPRSHHCRELGACILKMDHYCPWIDNCVGYRNHKFFILFVFYASLGLSNLIFISLFRLIVDVVLMQ